jgi:hypothetical protein
MVVGSWLAAGVLAAGPPFEPPQTGGIPQCQADLAECTINLTETENLLQVCDDALAACQETQGQAFPATGQVSCWNTLGNPIDCAGTGHDGDIQAGAELSYTDTGLTIIDNNTRLEWMKQDNNNGADCASDPSYLDMDCTFTWDGAFAFVATLNTNNHAGHSDWRMPNVKELQSIVNYQNFAPAVSAEFNTGCVAGCTVDACSCTSKTGYWSSTSYAGDTFAGRPNLAWFVRSDSGAVGKNGKNLFRRVRAVRGGL